MKNGLFFLLLIISYFSNAQNNIDVLHYKYSIEISDQNDSIIGNASITLTIPKNTDSILLELSSINNIGKGMWVSDVSDDSQTAFVYNHRKDKISIKVNHVQQDEIKTIHISYRGIPADGLIISKNKFGQRTFFSDNWPNRAHNWIPCIDAPADKASVEFIVTAPLHYQVISNGILQEETIMADNKKLTHWKEDVPLPTKLMVIGAADFAVNYAGEVNGIPVSSWVFTGNKKEGFYDYLQAKEILMFYIHYIGPYPYKKLANVQSKTRFGGMENASAIFYSENSITGNREEESLLAHEIVHQWFGDMATEKSFTHLWLSEGFASYLTHVYIESKYGKDSLYTRMAKDRDKVMAFVKASRKSVVDSNADYMSLLNANSYEKGSWVLHMLRCELGDAIFKSCIQEYYTAYAGKNADTKDFQKVVEKVSHKNLEKFFSQWLYNTVNPSLKITWRFIEKTHSLQMDILQAQEGTLFHFPLDVEVKIAGGKKTSKKLMINSRQTSVSLVVSGKPIQVIIDPNVSLLFEGTVKELK
jgi:aminopeptidase N